MRNESCRLSTSTLLLFGLTLAAGTVVAACAGDTPTSPQLDGSSGLTPASGAAADLVDDGFRGDEVDTTDKEYNGEDGPFEHVIRAPNGLEIVFRFAGKIRAREEVSVTLRALQAGQAVKGAVTVDFGDDRRPDVFEVFRKAELTHTYRQEGGYRIFAVLETEDGLKARGGFRIRIDERLKVSLSGEAVGASRPGEDTRLRFSADASNARAQGRNVAGVLTVDYGDDSDVEQVKNFDGAASRNHVYENEGTYTVELTLEAIGRTFKGSFEVEVSDLPDSGDEVDLSQAIIALNSAHDIAKFPVTSQVTGVRITRNQICIYHTKSGRWPTYSGVTGNPWIAVYYQGQLHAGTYEWFRSGVACKSVTASNLGQHIKNGPLTGWRPRKGDKVYLFVSTLARLNLRTINERSNVVEVIWPY